MSTSTLKFYKCNITPQRNCIVDDISSYLNSLTSTTVNDFQFQKIELNKKIRINLAQGYQSFRYANYVEVIQPLISGTNKSYYYFILKSNWKAENTVEFELSLDTLNTFQSNFLFDSKTTVTREHKDRWLDSSHVLTPNTTFTRAFNIDKTDEGLTNIPKIAVADPVRIDDDVTEFKQNWYLVYISNGDDATTSPIECRLYPKESSQILYPSVGSVTLTASDLEDGYTYWLILDDLENFGSTYQITGGTIHTIGSESSDDMVYGLVMQKNNTTINYMTITADYYSTVGNTPRRNLVLEETVWSSAANITIANNAVIRYQTSTTYVDVRQDAIRLNPIYMRIATNAPVAQFDSVDRTNSRLIKILECPYCPIDLTIDDDHVITLPTGWGMRGDTILCTDVSVELLRNVSSVIDIDGMGITFTTGADVTKTAKSMDFEPKLYNSTVSTLKLVYDSFNTEIKREMYTNTNYYLIPKLSVNYKQSNNINSALAFDFDFDYAIKNARDVDYSSYLISNRTNDMTIYNSAYLNYIRTGYNYDKRVNQRSEIQRAISAGIQLVGAAVSIAGGIGTGGISAAAGISLATSAIATITNNISTTASNEQSLQQKLNELRNQSLGLNGVDDINLLNYYNENKLWVYTYEASPAMKQNIYDLFYYCGYADTTKHIPNTDTRYWFNYVQCDPIFSAYTSNVYEEYLEDMKAKFQIGVTYYHAHNNEYDWDQEYENWETGLIQ